MFRNNFWKLIALCALCLSPSQASAAGFDIIIDDVDVDFSEWYGGILQTGFGDNSYGGSYRYVTDWGSYDGIGLSPSNASARAFYRLPANINFPAGERLYNIYAWSPESNWDQWHAVDVAANGTENFDQQISWPGQFGTNKQWLAFDPNEGVDPELGGRWIKLGPGPQSDPLLDGAVYINPSINQKPYLYVGYQPWFTGTIAFDAIRIVELVPIPEPSSITMASMGFVAFGAMARRLRNRRSRKGLSEGV
jgi:hypothetical protein